MTDVATAPITERQPNIAVLGPLEAQRDGDSCDLGGPKQRTVLAVLVASAGRRVSTDAIIEAVYGLVIPHGARRSVQTYVSNLRSELGHIITGSRDGYRAEIGDDHLDAIRFEHEVVAAREILIEDPQRAAQRLRRALGLWRGHPYADIDGGPVIATEITRLQELRQTALEARIDADLALGHHESLVPELEALTSEYPFRERLRAQHMLALYRSGRQAEALRAYQLTRTTLADELGIDPSPQLRELEQQILEHDDRLRYAPAPSVRRSALLAVDLDTAVLEHDVPAGDRVERLVATDSVVREAISGHSGAIFAQRLNATFASFPELSEALDAAAAIVREAPELSGSDRRPLVGLSVDVGDVVSGDEGTLAGPVVTRIAGLVAMAHPGQMLISRDAHVEAAAKSGRIIKSLGEHAIPQLDRREGVYQLVVDGLTSDFPPLRTEGNVAIPGGMRSMPGYELREEVARGPAWSVWRAYQPSVGRQVAIKIISPELASRQEFVRRFELEALTVARLEHPHIVPLFDYWRDLSGAYLVSRWVSGGNLAERTAQRPLDLAEASRLVAEVGSALESAHRSGVAHGAVGPAKILVDDSGAFYLHDFGVAVGPERTPSADLVAQDTVGLVDTVIAASAGERSVQEVVDHLRTPTRPLADVADVRATWRRAVGGSAAGGVGYTPARNPYLGLAAFSYADAQDFFGRDDVIACVLAGLEAHRLVAVVGPSGVGKSSVVHAGVMPAVVNGALRSSDRWFIAQMTPGSHPFEAFASAMLRVGTEPLACPDEVIVDGDEGLLRAATRHFPDGAEMLLIIDQFEELFTVTADSQERQRFLRSLATLVTDEESNARVVVTIRADFFDQPLAHPEFGNLVRRATVPVAAPTADEVRLMIERPAGAVGIQYQAGLVDRIIADVGEEPGRLPLLEYALTELFNRRTSDVITADVYTAIGGVLGALGRGAEAIFAELDGVEQAAARQVLLRLVTLADAERVARRRVRRSELQRLDVDPAAVDGVIHALAAHRLVTLDCDMVTHGPTVEVAHEAIFAEWARLAGWIDERREDLAIRRRFVEASAEWEQADRDPAMLVTGGRLAHLSEWADATDLSLATTERDFLEASIDWHATAAEAARRRRRRIMVGFATAAVIAVLLALVAWTQRNAASADAALAQGRELILEAEKALPDEPELAIHLALAALEGFSAAGREAPESALDVLRRGIAADRTVARIDAGRVLSVSADGQTIAAAGSQGHVELFDAESFERIETLEVGSGELVDLWFSRRLDELYAVVGSGGTGERSMLAWNLVERSWETLPVSVPSGESSSWGRAMAVSDDGRIVFVSQGDSIVAFDRHTGTSLSTTPVLRGSAFATFGTDVSFVVSLADGSPALRTQDVETGDVRHTIGLPVIPGDVSFSPEGLRVAFSTNEGQVGAIDIAQGRLTWFRDDLDRARLPLWLPSGDRILVGGEDRLELVDAETGETVLQPAGSPGSNFSYDAIPGTELVVTTGPNYSESLVINVSRRPPGEVGVWRSPIGQPFSMHPNNTGDRLLLRGRVGDLAVVDGGTGEVLFQVTSAHLDQLPNFSNVSLATRDARFIAGADADARYKVWSAGSGTVLFTATNGLGIVGVNDDASLVVLHRNDGVTQLVRTEDGSIVAELDAGALNHRSVFTPDGRYVMTNNNGGDAPFLRFFDVADGTFVAGLGGEEDEPGGGWWTEFTRDGTALVVGGYDGVVRTYDVSTLLAGGSDGEAIMNRIPAHATFVILVEVSADGSMVASSAWDEPAKLWDLNDGRLLGQFGDEQPTAVAFHPTEPRLFVSQSGYVTVHTLDAAELMEIARAGLSRVLTDEECRRYLRRPCDAT